MDTAAPTSIAALRARIGWLCQSLRFAALAYPLWIFVLLTLHWSDAEEVTRVYSHWLRAPLLEVPTAQRAGGFLIQMVAVAFTALACLNLWKLFTGFLAGRVFTLDAALTLRCLSLAGLAAVAIELVSRPLLIGLMSLHMPPGSRHLGFFFHTTDMLNLMFLGGLLALAQVFKVAAEIAEDHAAIV
jgi:hypothetical protein